MSGSYRVAPFPLERFPASDASDCDRAFFLPPTSSFAADGTKCCISVFGVKHNATDPAMVLEKWTVCRGALGVFGMPFLSFRRSVPVFRQRADGFEMSKLAGRSERIAMLTPVRFL